MLGTEIRGIKHLHKLALTQHEGLHVFVPTQTHTVREYIMFPLAKEEKRVDAFTIKNDDSRHLMCYLAELDNADDRKSGSHICSTHRAAYNKLKKQHKELIPFSSFNNPMRSLWGPLAVAVDENFEKEYEQFLKNNTKILSPVFEKYTTNQSSLAKYLYIISNGNANFFAWAIKMMMRHNISLYTIKHLLDFNNDHKNLIKHLNKSNLIAINSTKDVLNAVGESFFLCAQETAKHTVNWFNPNQKKMLKEKLSDKKIVDLLNNFSRLSHTKRINFIRKVSTISDINEIIYMMSFLCSHTHFEWSKDSLLNFIKNVENISCDIIYDKDNIVILQIHDFETAKRLGKTTNWCISKNKSYWKNYIGTSLNNQNEIREDISKDAPHLTQKDVNYEVLLAKDSEEYLGNHNAKQYMIFDFAEKEDSHESIVGVTIQNGEITHAHNFINTNLMTDSNYVGEEFLIVNNDRERNIHSLLDIWSAEQDKCSEEKLIKIHQYLQVRNIPVTVFGSYQYNRCEWNKESVIEYLLQFVDIDEIDVLFENDTKFLFRSQNPHVCTLFTNTAQALDITDWYDSNSSIWLLDFSLPKDDMNKIQAWCIYKTHSNIERTSIVPYNEQGKPSTSLYKTFTHMLSVLGLPYDIISRPDTFDQKMITYINERNNEKIESTLQEMLSKGATLNDKVQQRLLRGIIEYERSHINQKHSMLESFSDKFKLDSIFDKQHLKLLASNLIETVRNNYMVQVPSPKFDAFKIHHSWNGFNKEKIQYINNIIRLNGGNEVLKNYEYHNARCVIYINGIVTKIFNILDKLSKNTTYFSNPFALLEMVLKKCPNPITTEHLELSNLLLNQFIDFFRISIDDFDSFSKICNYTYYPAMCLLAEKECEKIFNNSNITTKHLSHSIHKIHKAAVSMQHINQTTQYLNLIKNICNIGCKNGIISEQVTNELMSKIAPQYTNS